MGLEDADFKDDDEREEYRQGEKYRKLVKTEGWKDLRLDMNETVKNRLEKLAVCEIDKIEHLRGVVAGYREIINKVEGHVSTADQIEKEIKNIPEEVEDD